MTIKGGKASPEARAKMCMAAAKRDKSTYNRGPRPHARRLYGKDNPMFGKHLIVSEETKEKIRLGKWGEKNPRWAGYDAKIGYAMLHRWVHRRMPKPELCPECNTRPAYDLANITGIYNRDLENWKWLCRKCHMLSDGRMNNLFKWRNRTVSIG